MSTRKTMPCLLCNAELCSSSSRSRHMRNKHGADDQKVHQCRVCEKRFKEKWILKRHENAVHAGITPYGCDICEDTFSYKWQVNHHKAKVHQVGPRFECLICKKVLTVKGNYEQHCTICTGEPQARLQCYICRHTYKNYASLRSHQHLSHNEDSAQRMHVCDLCGKSFARRHHLARHLNSKMHTTDGQQDENE